MDPVVLARALFLAHASPRACDPVALAAALRERGLPDLLGPGALARALGFEAPDLEPALEEAPARLSALGRRNIQVIVRGEPGYPAELLGAVRPPPAIALRGELPPGPYVSIVGSRGAAVEAVRRARALGKAAAEAGLAVVSGGALGIDAAAHQGALDAGGRTLVIVGGGVLHAGPPQNRRLFARCLASRGALLSESPPGAHPLPHHFVERNRLIAAFSPVTAVPQARAGSEALYTAEFAEDLGRILYATPGAGAGCDTLLLRGARPLHAPADLLAAYGRAPEPAPEALTDIERALRDGPLSLPELSARLGRPASALAAELVSLQKRGKVRPAGPGRFA